MSTTPRKTAPAAPTECAGRFSGCATPSAIAEVDIEDLIASGDRVVARVRFSATQTGELFGKPATGRRFEAEQVHIWRVADGRLAEHWMFRDDLGTMRQLGLAA